VLLPTCTSKKKMPMKNVLIPTDFSIESLHLLQMALRMNKGNDPLNIVLLYGYHLSDSIMELLFRQGEEVRKQIVPKEFQNAYEMIKNRNESKISSIRLDRFTGFTKAAMRNFIDAHDIDEIFLAKGYAMHPANKRCFDVTPFLRGLNKPTFEVAWVPTGNEPEKNLPAELFLFGSR
jgi:hypothetical protein